MNTIEIKNLTKVYPNGTKALNNLSLTVNDGMYGLLGPNGAGKSSLMRTIAGLQKPTSGTIFFNEVNIVNEPQYMRKSLGYLPQEFGVYPKISAYNLLDYIALLKGITDKTMRKQQINELLAISNLQSFKNKSVSSFSGGMRRRFGIAQALLGKPKLLMVDEPTAGLDPEERNRFLNVLSEVSSSMIVFLSTHIVEDVQGLCSQAAIMKGGVVEEEGSTRDLIDRVDGKIWMAQVDKEELARLQRHLQVISTKLIGGKNHVFVYAEKQPSNSFKEVSADLEHAYFKTLSKLS